MLLRKDCRELACWITGQIWTVRERRKSLGLKRVAAEVEKEAMVSNGNKGLPVGMMHGCVRLIVQAHLQTVLSGLCGLYIESICLICYH